MRLYSFVNYYLSPLQHGLQTAHCVSELSVRYNANSRERLVYRDWAVNHKTIIICNGGNTAMLEDLHLRLVDHAHEFELPLTKFYEDEQSLNNALTSVALVVPPELYDVKFVPADLATKSAFVTKSAYVYEPEDGPGLRYEEGMPEYDFIALLKSFRLA